MKNAFTKTLMVGACLAAALASPSPDVFAQGGQVFTYPMRGQSRDDHDRDRRECSQFAIDTTRFDPPFERQWLTRSQDQLRSGIPATPAPDPNRGGAGTGALIGVTAGAIGGGIAGNVGAGAAIGAASGALFGGARRSNARSERQQWDHHQATRKQQELRQLQAQFDAGMADYERAFSVCMRGRGYEVM